MKTALTSYLSSTRSRIVLACILVASVVLAKVPAIDLVISGGFFESGFTFEHAAWPRIVQRGTKYLLVASVLAMLVVYLVNRRSGRDIGGIDGRHVVYLLALLVIGAGLIINVALKDTLGRARPRDVAEFGGTSQFTPAFAMSRECDRNCSFPSGDAAAAFFFLASARALRPRRLWLTAGTAVAAAVISLSRIAVGAHFFSDVVISFFVMWIVAGVLYRCIVDPGVRVPAPALETN